MDYLVACCLRTFPTHASPSDPSTPLFTALISQPMIRINPNPPICKSEITNAKIFESRIWKRSVKIVRIGKKTFVTIQRIYNPHYEREIFDFLCEIFTLYVEYFSHRMNWIWRRDQKYFHLYTPTNNESNPMSSLWSISYQLPSDLDYSHPLLTSL